jgi:hypothetical protein
MFGFLRRVAARINRHARLSVQRTYLYRISKPEGWPVIAANDKSPGWELLSPERVGQLLDIGPFDVSDGLQRLHSGERCYTVCIDGRLAHYSWVQRSGSHPITKAGVSVPVGSGEFWIYNCKTAEWAQGRGIYRAVLERIVNEHFEAGYCTAWIYTSRENIASQKGILRAGFGLVATLGALRVGSRYYRIGRIKASNSL